MLNKSTIATRGRRRWLGVALITLLVVVAIRWTVQTIAGEPEIALIYGEPWEDMRQRSSAEISPAIPGHYWFHIPKSDARLRFIDPQYGFVTPLARFFTISFDNERVASIRMSSQIEPLLLDDALKIVLDLQEQWHRGDGLPAILGVIHPLPIPPNGVPGCGM